MKGNNYKKEFSSYISIMKEALSRENFDAYNAAKDMLDEKFILMYCDNYCPIDFDRLVKDASENDALIQLSVYSAVRAVSASA